MVPVFTVPQRAELEQGVQIARDSTKPVALLLTEKCLDDLAFTVERIVADDVPAYRDTVTYLAAVRTAVEYREFPPVFAGGTAMHGLRVVMRPRRAGGRRAHHKEESGISSEARSPTVMGFTGGRMR